MTKLQDCRDCFWKNKEVSEDPCKGCSLGLSTYTMSNFSRTPEDFWQEKPQTLNDLLRERLGSKQEAPEVQEDPKEEAFKLWESVDQTLVESWEGQFDMVQKPAHYQLFPEHGIEVRDLMQALTKKMEDSKTYWFTAMDYSDYIQAMQYFCRFMEKGGKQDLEKGVWYINKIIEAWEDEAW